MTELDSIKLYLNIPLSETEKDPLLQMIRKETEHEIARRTNRDLEFIQTNPVAKSIVNKATVVKYNRRGTEGIKSQSYASSGESYVEGLEAEIKTQLNTITKVKLL